MLYYWLAGLRNACPSKKPSIFIRKAELMRRWRRTNLGSSSPDSRRISSSWTRTSVQIRGRSSKPRSRRCGWQESVGSRLDFAPCTTLGHWQWIPCLWTQMIWDQLICDILFHRLMNTNVNGTKLQILAKIKTWGHSSNWSHACPVT